MLETGGGDVERLRLIDDAYGLSTDSWLQTAGLREGMRVVEIGCGSGNITRRLARAVGPTGEVVGIDLNASQVEQAERLVRASGLSNVSFQIADAAAPNLPQGSFDLAYCRLVLMHMVDPVAAIQSMRDLVRPGGSVVCEEMDLSRWLCDPPSPAMERCFALKLALGELRGVHFRIGPELHRMFREAGLADPHVASIFAISLHDPFKRSTGLSLQSFGASLFEHGLVGAEELDQLVAELLRLADDPSILVGLPMMFQAWARR
jgi:ubiquinone/menaquinone biosynthesis C-methylase UbiE